MYVDKKLGGVQCVQTLSRLNRTTSGKSKTFVLDFVNDTEDIVQSFQPYFTSTILSEETDPDKLYDLVYKIEAFNLYTKGHLDAFCQVFYSNKSETPEIQYYINEVVERYNERLNDEEKELFKSTIQSYLRMYSYISQIATFSEVHWEKTFVFLTYLNKKLPKRDAERVSILDAVDLDSFRIQKMGETNLTLVDLAGELPPPVYADGKGKKEEEKELLSQIIEKINDLFGSGLREDDKVTVDLMREELRTNTDVTKVLNGDNSEDAKMEYFNQKVKDMIIDIYSDKFDLYKKLMNDQILPQFVSYLYQSMKDLPRDSAGR
jgi:type I restriction enzyme R subunit